MARRAGTKKALGYLGPAIVLVGFAVAGVAIWYVRTAAPVPGDIVDKIESDSSHIFVIRADAKDPRRSFLELRDHDTVKWQALIPHYAGAPGRPAIAWSHNVVTVRVERAGRAEVFAFTIDSHEKVGALRLAPEHEPITTQASGPITLSDHVRSYELAGGADWNQVVAIGLDNGKGVWKVDLGPAPVTNAGIEGANLWIEQGGKRRSFDLRSGAPTE